MENSKDRIQSIIEKGMKAGASAVKVRTNGENRNACHFKNGSLKNIDSADKSYIHVSVIKDGKLGTGLVTSLNDIEDGLARAFDMARVGKQMYFSAYPAAGTYPGVKLSSDDVEALTTDYLIEESSRFCDAMASINKNFSTDCSSFVHIWNNISAFSNGVYKEMKETAWVLQGGIQLSEDGDLQQTWDFRGSRRAGKDVNYDLIIDAVKTSYEYGRTIAATASGNLPVIFDPDSVNSLGWILNLGVNGKQVAEKASPLCDKLGTKILADNITIVDDPHVDYDLSAAVMDNDGIPTRKMTVVDKGVLKAFAYDLNTAAKEGVEPTGHSGSSLTSSRLLGGKKPWKELLKEIDRGIYVENMLGFGQGNLINGDFNANVGRGFLIEKGEIKGRVKNTMISGNLYELAKRNVLISSDIHPQYRQPWLVLDGVSVSSKG